jgi:hypothetical protein
MTQPTLSPDGRYRWDGQQWIPNDSPPPGSPTMPATPGKRRRWPWVVAVTAVLFVGVCSAAVAASGGTKSTSTAKATATPAHATAAAPAAAAKAAAPAARDGSCSPQPCANDNYGWIVAVSSFKYDAASGNQFETPEAGNVYVTLEVTFTNKLSREQNANPSNFVLLDGAGIKHTVTFMSTCPLWSPVNLTTNATLGPKCLAFEAAAAKSSGLSLVWTPSLVGGDYNMKLN